jgi:cellulose synthase/poly-beta-1,6-N-acetylglucosamine synthase-like glycosyltransferase
LIQDYPKALFDVIVIADSLKPETVAQLRELPITTYEVTFETSTKAKALNYAMSQLTEQYDIALILDADNIMATDFITKLNATLI